MLIMQVQLVIEGPLHAIAHSYAESNSENSLIV